MSDEELARFTAAEHIQQLLRQRGWSQADLAQVMGRPPQVISEILRGNRGISPRTARELAAVFGTTPEIWRKVDRASRTSKVAATSGDDLEIRSDVYRLGPIKEMIRRGWIAGSRKAVDLAEQVKAFYKIPTLDVRPTFDFHAARKSTTYEESNLAQIAWLHQARRVSEPLEPSGKFSQAALNQAIVRLRGAARTEEGVAQVSTILSEAGIRFVVVQHLPQTRFDGACFWLKDSSPVIALSMRFERIDHFWHTLFHELGHVKAGDGKTSAGRVDTDLPGSRTPPAGDRPPSEVSADEFAARELVPPEALASFMQQNRPYYSKQAIKVFAEEIGVHPGIVVGQLQYRGEILYSHSRDLLVSVRDLITANAQTDGWKRSA